MDKAWEALRLWIASERDEFMDPVDRDQYQLVLDKMDELEREAAPIQGAPELYVNGEKREMVDLHVVQEHGSPATVRLAGEDLGYCIIRLGERRVFLTPKGLPYTAPSTIHLDQVTWDQRLLLAKGTASG